MAKALLIDVVNQSVTSITISDPTDSIAKIGNGCSSTEAYKLPNGDFMLYDMGGFFRTPEGGFSLTPMNWLLMSKAVVMGWDEQNGSIGDCITKSAEIKKNITWYDATYCEQAQK